MEEVEGPKHSKDLLSLKQIWFLMLIIGLVAFVVILFGMYQNRTVYQEYLSRGSVKFEYPDDWQAQSNDSGLSQLPNDSSYGFIQLTGPVPNGDQPDYQLLNAIQKTSPYSFLIVYARVPQNSDAENFYNDYKQMYPNSTEITTAKGQKMIISSGNPQFNSSGLVETSNENSSANAVFVANGYAYNITYKYPPTDSMNMDPMYAAAYKHLLNTFQPQYVSDN